jgi:peptidoglycan/LPS O-acetylase OafA/YrhL
MLYLRNLHIMDTSHKEHQTTNSIHITAFDTVRGLAALSVVFSHYIGAYGLPTQSNLWKQAWMYSPLHIVWDGFAAVSLFYVLSGLVLSLKYFRDTKRPELAGFKLSHFLIGRVFRIWPPYLAVFLASYVVRRAIGFDDNLTIPAASRWLFSTWGDSVPFWQLGREAILAPMDTYFLVPQGWTLPIELIISFFIPLGILLASRNSLWLIFFTLVAIGPLGATYFVFHFAVGLLIAKYYQEILVWLEPRRGWKVAALLAGVFLYTFRFTLPVYFKWQLPVYAPWIITGIGSALLLMVVIASARARTFLSLAWLRHIGRISYSIYLVHFLVLIFLIPRFFIWLDSPQAYAQAAWGAGLTMTIVLTVGLATLSHRWVELPSMALGKSLVTRLRELQARRARGIGK